MQGLIGKKLGMTQVYDEDGRRVAVTVIEAGPCVVVQRKSKGKEGYDAVQLGFGDQKPQRLNKPTRTRFEKANAAPKRVLLELPLDEGDEVKPGDSITVSIFEGVPFVDVIGTTKGRGFAGVVKRYNMRGGRMTHGGHSKRRVGAIGQCAYPGRVAKGQKMPGHMGHVRRTQQNLKVLRVEGDQNILLVRGAIPGPTGGIVVVRKAIKKAVKG